MKNRDLIEDNVKYVTLYDSQSLFLTSWILRSLQEQAQNFPQQAAESK